MTKAHIGDKAPLLQVSDWVQGGLVNFDQLPETQQQGIQQQAQHYLQSLTYHAETFELFELKGTPSHILVDKQGLLRDCAFGGYPDLETRVLGLLRE